MDDIDIAGMRARAKYSLGQQVSVGDLLDFPTATDLANDVLALLDAYEAEHARAEQLEELMVALDSDTADAEAEISRLRAALAAAESSLLNAAALGEAAFKQLEEAKRELSEWKGRAETAEADSGEHRPRPCPRPDPSR